MNQNSSVDNQAENDDIVITIRLLVKGNKVGTIIGKGGDRISAMRKDSGCQIKIQGNDQHIEQIVTISGSLNGVVKAMHTVAVYNEESNNKDGNRSTKYPATLHIVVPAVQCGAIIGTGGFRIKEIRNSTGCMVRIGREHLPRSTEKLITLSGTPDVIRTTIEKICQVMISEDQPSKGESRCIPYTPTTYGPSPVFGGGAVAPGGAGAPSGAPSTGVADQATYAALGYGYQTGANPIAATVAHHPAYTTTATPYTIQQNFAATPQGHPAIAHVPNPHEPPTLMGPLGPINPVELLAETDTLFFKNQLKKQKLPDGQTEFHIPKEMMGSVIGQRGSIIKEIRALTTPDIKIHEQEDGSTFRKLHVAGGADVIERVNLLLHVCVNVYHEARDKIGSLNMLQAVQYGQAMKHKQEPDVQHYTMPYQKPPQGMPFTPQNPGYTAQYPVTTGSYPPPPQYPQAKKRQHVAEPNMSNTFGIETPPQHKREKFLQYQ